MHRGSEQCVPFAEEGPVLGGDTPQRLECIPHAPSELEMMLMTSLQGSS